MDLNWLYLYLGKNAQDSGRIGEMTSYYDKIERVNLFNMLHSKEFAGNINNQSFRMIAYAIEGYIKAGQADKAHALVSVFKNPVNRSSLYAFAATELLKEGDGEKMVQPLIDSALAEMARKENRSNDQPNRRNIAYALTMQDPSGNADQAYALIKNLPGKMAAMEDICRSFAFHKNLHGAMEHIPAFNSGTDQADFLGRIQQGYTEGTKENVSGWGKYNNNYLRITNLNIVYVDESN